MPTYVHKQILRYYKHHPPKRPQDCPYEPNPIKYEKNSDHLDPIAQSPYLDKHGKKYIQQVVGSFLYYARAIDMTILIALSAIAADQANPTEATLKRVHHLLDYMQANPNAVIRF